jgi:hypothetical protein
MLYIQPLNAKEIAELEKLTRKAVGRIAERAWYILLPNQGKSIPEIRVSPVFLRTRTLSD